MRLIIDLKTNSYMKKQKSINILNNQKNKLNIPNKNDENWIIQTASYVKEIFGEESTEFEFIKKFTFEVEASTYSPKEEILASQVIKMEKAKGFIDNCIETINQKGLPKIKNGNFLQKLSDTWLSALLLMLLSTIATVSFFLGQYVSDVKNFELMQENRILKEKIGSNGNENSNDNLNSKNIKDSKLPQEDVIPNNSHVKPPSDTAKWSD